MHITCTFEAVFEDNHDLTCRIRETETEPIAQQVQQPQPQRQQQCARVQQQQQPCRRRQRVRHDRRQQQVSRDAQGWWTFRSVCQPSETQKLKFLLLRTPAILRQPVIRLFDHAPSQDLTLFVIFFS